jgi:hypothetical protein
MRSIPYLISLGVAVIMTGALGGCEPRPHLWYPNSFHTGRVLEPGGRQAAVHTFLYGPAYGSFTMSLGQHWEGLIGLGQVGQIGKEAPILGANLAIERAHLKFWWISSTAGLELEGFATPSQLYPGEDLLGAQVFASYSAGAFPKDWLGVFGFVKGTYVRADWEDDISSGFGLIPGFGVTLERRHLFLRGAFSQGFAIALPPKPDVDDLRLWYYPGLQIGYRW